jgi:precorrin-6B methylase 1
VDADISMKDPRREIDWMFEDYVVVLGRQVSMLVQGDPILLCVAAMKRRSTNPVDAENNYSSLSLTCMKESISIKAAPLH